MGERREIKGEKGGEKGRGGGKEERREVKGGNRVGEGRERGKRGRKGN